MSARGGDVQISKKERAGAKTPRNFHVEVGWVARSEKYAVS